MDMSSTAAAEQGEASKQARVPKELESWDYSAAAKEGDQTTELKL